MRQLLRELTNTAGVLVNSQRIINTGAHSGLKTVQSRENNPYLYLSSRRGHDVLRDQLPSKEEHVILVRLSPLQRALYTEFMNRFREAGNTGWLSLNPLKAFCVCCKVRRDTEQTHQSRQTGSKTGGTTG